MKTKKKEREKNAKKPLAQNDKKMQKSHWHKIVKQVVNPIGRSEGSPQIVMRTLTATKLITKKSVLSVLYLSVFYRNTYIFFQ